MYIYWRSDRISPNGLMPKGLLVYSLNHGAYDGIDKRKNVRFISLGCTNDR